MTHRGGHLGEKRAITTTEASLAVKTLKAKKTANCNEKRLEMKAGTPEEQ